MRIFYDSRHAAHIALGVAHARRNISLGSRCNDSVLRSDDFTFRFTTTLATPAMPGTNSQTLRPLLALAGSSLRATLSPLSHSHRCTIAGCSVSPAVGVAFEPFTDFFWLCFFPFAVVRSLVVRFSILARRLNARPWQFISCGFLRGFHAPFGRKKLCRPAGKRSASNTGEWGAGVSPLLGSTLGDVSGDVKKRGQHHSCCNWHRSCIIFRRTGASALTGNRPPTRRAPDQPGQPRAQCPCTP